MKQWVGKQNQQVKKQERFFGNIRNLCSVDDCHWAVYGGSSFCGSFAGFVGGSAIDTVIGDINIGLILGIMLGTAFAKFSFKWQGDGRDERSTHIVI